MDLARCQAVQTAFLFKAIADHCNSDKPYFVGFSYDDFVNSLDMGECAIVDQLFLCASLLEDMKRAYNNLHRDDVCIAFEYEITEELIGSFIALTVFRYKELPSVDQVKLEVIKYFKAEYNLILPRWFCS